MAAVALPILLKACVGLLCGIYYLMAVAVVWPITQFMLNQSTMETPYSVILPCNGTSRAMMYTELKFNFKAWLYCDFLPKEWEVSVAPYDASGREVSVGTVKWPTMALPPGTTAFNFTSSIELDDPEFFVKKFINPIFLEGKAMKLVFSVQKLQLQELKILPMPNLHMQKAMLCKAKETPPASKMPANVCGDWFHGQVPFPSVVPAPHVADTSSEDLNEMIQMTDLVPMASRRLHTNEKKHGYGMECVPGVEDPSEPPVAV